MVSGVILTSVEEDQRQDNRSYISQLVTCKPMKMWLQQSDALGAADKKQIFDPSKTFYRQSESEEEKGCNSRRFYLVGLEYL